MSNAFPIQKLSGQSGDVSNLPEGLYEAQVRVNSATFDRSNSQFDFNGNGSGPFRFEDFFKYASFDINGSNSGGLFINFGDRDNFPNSEDSLKTTCDSSNYISSIPSYWAVPYTNGKVNPKVSCRIESAYIYRSRTQGITYYYYYIPRMPSCDATLVVRERTEAATAELSTPTGSFYPGQQVPVTARFSFPLAITQNMTLTINGQTLTPVETGTTADCCTFLYTVKTPLDNAKLSYESASLRTPDKLESITGISAVIENPVTQPEMVVSVPVNSDGRFTSWLGTTMKPVEGGAGFYSESLQVSADGESFYPFTTTSEEVTGQTLTARIPLELNTGEDPISRTVELYLDGDVALGWIAQAEQSPVKFIGKNDVTVSLSVLNAQGQPYEYQDEAKTIYVQDSPKITANYKLNGEGFSFVSQEQLVWSSNNEAVAGIAPDGTITPTGKAGKASFTLTAKKRRHIRQGGQLYNRGAEFRHRPHPLPNHPQPHAHCCGRPGRDGLLEQQPVR